MLVEEGEREGGRKREGMEGGGGCKEGSRRLQKSSGGKARPVKMFADVSWERG